MNRAHQIDAEVERAARKGLRLALSIAATTRAATVMAYIDGLSTGAAIRQGMAPLAPLLQSGMAESHGRGMLSAVEWADMKVKGKKSGVGLPRRKEPYDAGLDFLKSRLLLTDHEQAQLIATYGVRAASVTGEISSSLEQRVHRAVIEARRQDLHVREGAALIRKAFDNAGFTPRNRGTAEAIFRTQMALANSAGRWAANSKPEIDEILWGYEYNTVGDDRVRETHAAMDGVRAPKDDGIWRRWTPPCGFNCRCTLIEIFTDDPATRRRKKQPKKIGGEFPEPDAGWSFNPGDLYRFVTGAGLSPK